MASYLGFNRNGEQVNKRPRSLEWIIKRQKTHNDMFTIKRSKPPKRNWKVLVKKSVGKGWREASRLGRKRFTRAQAEKFQKTLMRRDKKTKLQKVLTERQIDDALINTWLSGDLDFDRSLMIALARTSRDCKHKLHVNYGKRTRAEQAVLFAKYGPGRAARPGTSRHETGKAADTVSKRFRWKNAGDVKGFRTLGRRHGVCLPVRGEAWHVEMGTTWRA